MPVTASLFEKPRSIRHKHSLTLQWARLFPTGEVTPYHRYLWWNFREFALANGMAAEEVAALRQGYENTIEDMAPKSWGKRHLEDLVIFIGGSVMILGLWFTLI